LKRRRSKFGRKIRFFTLAPAKRKYSLNEIGGMEDSRRKLVEEDVLDARKMRWRQMETKLLGGKAK